MTFCSGRQHFDNYSHYRLRKLPSAGLILAFFSLPHTHTHTHTHPFSTSKIRPSLTISSCLISSTSPVFSHCLVGLHISFLSGGLDQSHSWSELRENLLIVARAACPWMKYRSDQRNQSSKVYRGTVERNRSFLFPFICVR